MGFCRCTLPLMPAASWLHLSARPAIRVVSRSSFTISVFSRLLQASRLLLFFFLYQIILKYSEQIQTLFRHMCVWCKREGLLSSEDLPKTVLLNVKTQTGWETTSKKNPWRRQEFGWRLRIQKPPAALCIHFWVAIWCCFPNMKQGWVSAHRRAG